MNIFYPLCTLILITFPAYNYGAETKREVEYGRYDTRLLSTQEFKAAIKAAVNKNNPHSVYALLQYHKKRNAESVREAFQLAATQHNVRVGEVLSDAIDFTWSTISLPEYQLIDNIRDTRAKRQKHIVIIVHKAIDGLKGKRNISSKDGPLRATRNIIEDFLVMPRFDNFQKKEHIYRPLQDAIQQDDADTVTRLINSGCAVDGNDAAGNTYLMMAAERGNRPILQSFIQGGAMLTGDTCRELVNIAIKHRNTARDNDEKKNAERYEQVVEYMNAMPMATTGEEYMQYCVQYKDAYNLNHSHLNLMRDPEITYNGRSVMFYLDTDDRRHTLAYAQELRLILRRMKQVPNSLYDGQRRGPIFSYRMFCQNALFAYELLKAGVNPNFLMQGNSPPLVYAMSAKSLDVVALLLQHKADPNKYDMNTRKVPLEGPILRGDEKMVELLLKAGADPNFLGEGKSSPMRLAVNNLWPKVVEVLLRYGATPSRRRSCCAIS